MSLSLLIVVICVFSCVCKLLFIMPSHLYFLRLFSHCLFHICDPLLFSSPPCRRKSVCWVSLAADMSPTCRPDNVCRVIWTLFPTQKTPTYPVKWVGCCIILPHLLPHLVLVDDHHINFSPPVVASFSLLDYWHVVCLQ